ncbi:MAG: EAL domain-containing protein [Ilumatobacteraceae bacterium]
MPTGHSDTDNSDERPDEDMTAPVDDFALPEAVRALLDADRTAVVILDLDGTIRSVNQAALDLLDADTVDMLHRGSPGHVVLRSLLDHAPRHLAMGTAEGTWQGDIDHTGPLGEQLVYRATVTTRRGGDGTDAAGFIGLTAHDVTSARDEASKLRHRASHDPLTGLANRRQILATLAHAVSLQRGRPGHVAAIFVDVDRLKYVNDALGHQIGDRLLMSTARRLDEVVRPQDHVARIGGDEFLVVCSEINDADEAMEVAERIRGALTGRLRIRQLDLNLSVSIGVALSESHLEDAGDVAAASSLISDSDTAMYEAKNTGRSRSVLFTPEMRTATRERTELGAELARAIDERRLRIEYQPVFSAVTRQAVGAEALVRWKHPERGQIDPLEFVTVAEQSGTIGKLGEFVLGQAMAETRRWIEAGTVGDDFATHVNVSQIQLASTTFVNQTVGLLRLHRLRPSQLVLEVRENVLLGRSESVSRSVRSLRRIGVRVAIDNFGTGANALSVLTDVGADVLKLDGAFGLPPGSTETDGRLVRAVVLLAHALDMRVVAERVSGPDQLRRLRSAGCDYVQGNLLAPAAPPEHLVTWTSH